MLRSKPIAHLGGGKGRMYIGDKVAWFKHAVVIR